MSSPPPWPIKPYTPTHQTWPYAPSDFTRQDPSPDASFYTSPRFVTHIDDAAIATLRTYYASTLPHHAGSKILDFCSSWISHYPASIETARGDVSIIGMGMNAEELAANSVLNSGRIVRDLNVQPDIAQALELEGCIVADDEVSKLDAATNVVSTDYLTRPVEVLSSLRAAMKMGGMVHLVISNRCFPTKAISRWLRVGEEERLQMVGDFLHFAGWKGIEIVELSDGRGGGEEGSLRGVMAYAGMGRRDPLWVVRAVKE